MAQTELRTPQLKDITIEGDNVGLGSGTLASLSTGLRNTAIGNNALNTLNTSLNCTAIGDDALKTTAGAGGSNTAIGQSSLALNTIGANNCAIGVYALGQNTTGVYSMAIGNYALYGNTVGTYNVSVGAYALNDNVSSSYCTAIGSYALDVSLGQNNTAVGGNSLGANVTGFDNTAVGVDSLDAMTNYDNCTGLGHDSAVTGDNQVQLGDANTTSYAYGALQDRSDRRDKADIRDTTLGLEFIDALRPVEFIWDMRDSYKPGRIGINPPDRSSETYEIEKAEYDVAMEQWVEENKLSNLESDGSKKRTRYHQGLVAQEVKSVMDDLGVDFGGFQDHKVKGGDDVLTIGYTELIPIMIKAIQELSKVKKDKEVL